VADDHLDADLFEQPLGAGDFGELADVIDEADEHGNAEIGHQPHLDVRPRLDTGPRRQEDGVSEVRKCLADIMPTVDHAMTVNRMDDVGCSEALPAHHPRDQ